MFEFIIYYYNKEGGVLVVIGNRNVSSLLEKRSCPFLHNSKLI